MHSSTPGSSSLPPHPEHQAAGPSRLLDVANLRQYSPSETDSIFSRDDEPSTVLLEDASTSPPQYQLHDPSTIIDLTGDTPPPPPVAIRAQSVSSSVVDLTGPPSPILVPYALVGMVIDLTEE